MLENLSSDRKADSFFDVFNKFWARGMRPKGQQRSKWTPLLFAYAAKVSTNTVRNWRRGNNFPDLDNIEIAFLGVNNDDDDEEYKKLRCELRNSYYDERIKRKSKKIKNSKKNKELFKSDNSPSSLIHVDKLLAISTPMQLLAGSENIEEIYNENGIISPDRCYGREKQELFLVRALVDATSKAALMVLGAPGIGKTTLTRQVASNSEVERHFKKCCWFVELETVKDIFSFEVSIIQSIGLNPAITTFKQALKYLDLKRNLLVLDNFETPWEADPEGIQLTLRQIVSLQNVSVIVSMRGNTAPPSPRWTSRPMVLQKLDDITSRLLFLELAPNISKDDECLQSFIVALGGIPLAIELVAYRASPHSSLAELWDEWERRGIALASHPDISPTRLSSLERSIDLSLQSQRLRAEGLKLFRLLGELPGGISRVDRIEFLGKSALEANRQIISIGLAIEIGNRTDLLPPIRDYSRRMISDKHEFGSNWWTHYISLVRNLGSQFGYKGGDAAAARLIPEVGNVEHAVRVSLSAGDLKAAIEIVPNLARFYRFTGVGSFGIFHELIEACSQENNKIGKAICLEGIGFIAFVRYMHNDASKTYKEALELNKSECNKFAIARCLQNLGVLSLAVAKDIDAYEYFREAIKINKLNNNQSGTTDCVWRLGDIAFRRSQFEIAKKRYSSSLKISRVCEYLLGEANSILSLGRVAFEQGNATLARKMYDFSLALYRKSGSPRGEAFSIMGIADHALCVGRLDEARESYEQSLRLCVLVGDIVGQAACFIGFSDLSMQICDIKSAQKNLIEAIRLYNSVKDNYNEGRVYFILSNIAMDIDRNSLMNEAVKAWEAIGRTDLVDRCYEDKRDAPGTLPPRYP